MTLTTIKVPMDVRDRLKNQARRHQRTQAEQLAHLLAQQEQVDRFAEAKAAMQLNPPDSGYFREADEWTGPGWM